MSSASNTTTATPYLDTCPVGCAATTVPTDVVLPEGPLQRCTACGQLMSRIRESAYLESMRQFDQAGFNRIGEHEAERRFNVARRRLERVRKLLGKSAMDIRVLDVGCSRGSFLQAGNKLGFQMEGVEPAASVAADARASGLKVHTGLLEDIRFSAATFDALTLFEVVEHLKEPLSLLAECGRVLKPGGVLLISTGNAASWTVRFMRERWDYFHIAKDGGHISFFTPSSIALLAKRAGFDVIRIETSRVKFYEKADVSRARYAMAKLAAEALNLPARLAGRGHDMLAYLRAVDD